MLDEIVNHFLQSKEGGDVLAQLKTQGLDRPQATAAVNATAEGAMEQLGGGGVGTLAAGAAGGRVQPSRAQ